MGSRRASCHGCHGAWSPTSTQPITSSARRAREVARPRQVAMYLSKQLTPKSLPDIGRRFGGRDHTTVIHAVRQIEKLRASDAELDADIRLLTRQLEG